MCLFVGDMAYFRQLFRWSVDEVSPTLIGTRHIGGDLTRVGHVLHGGDADERREAVYASAPG